MEKSTKDYQVPPNTVCTPDYYWYGYSCTAGYVYSATIAYKGASAGGLNGGLGFTIRLADSNWRFFTEARYHYAFTNRVPSTFIPVTIGNPLQLAEVLGYTGAPIRNAATEKEFISLRPLIPTPSRRLSAPQAEETFFIPLNSKFISPLFLAI